MSERLSRFHARMGIKAVPAAPGVGSDPGECLWCGEEVTSERDAAGCTRPDDPAWAADGDFGCGKSPETTDDGVGDHARPSDAARWLREREAAPGMVEALRQRCHWCVVKMPFTDDGDRHISDDSQNHCFPCALRPNERAILKRLEG